jgi:NADPH:quinone reductase-like Zn-dependent oxidoreductase
MKAAVQHRYGPPDVVAIEEVETPVPGDHELLVKVRATTVNRTDCGYRAAHPFFIRVFSGLVRPKATILGNEFAGEVEAVGRDVTSFAVGERVFGYNEGSFGAHAQYLAIPEDGSIATMPAGLSFDEVAPSTEGSHYALAFIRRANIEPGDDVLVYGATGAIGSAAVQILHHLGAVVTAVCRSEHLALVERLGADRVVDYTNGDFTDEEQTYDVVFDAVGKSSFGRCRRLLKPRGVYLSSDLGPFSQNALLPLATRWSRGRKVLFPVPREDPHMVEYFKELLESGAFKPVVDRRYPLDQIVEAYRYVETGQKVGNVVITVDHEDDRTT